MEPEIVPVDAVSPGEEWPVVVVGAGACGLVAALAAARAGARALVLEKGASLAGNTARSSGLIPAAGTRLQRAAGIADDTPELMLGDILEKNGHSSEPALTRLLCERAGPTVEWLVDELGCELICHTDFLYPGQRRLRMHGPPAGYGAALLRQLERAARAEPLVELRLSTPVAGLLTAGAGVAGVRAASGAIRAGAVVLALNGFGGSPRMVADYLGPAAAGALYYGSPHNTGDGIRWGLALGAEAAAMGAYQGHASVAAPDGPLVTWGLVVNGAVLLNRAGRRFGDELAGYSAFTADVLAQPGGEAWAICDARAYRATADTRFAEVIAAGRVVEAPTLGELAGRLGLPAEAVEMTAASVNAAARGERPDPFGRADLAGGLGEPPFYGVHVRGALFHTQGGLRVDERARVLRPGGAPIPGLYAGGGTAVGVSGPDHRGYSSGNGLLAAVVLGKIAGEAAAAQA